MSFFDTPITADQTQAQQAFAPLPEGLYNLVIDKSEEGKSKALNAMLKLTLTVNDGPFAARKVFANINLEHSNPEVVKIGMRQLHTLLIMAGLTQIRDATELTGRVLSNVKIKVKKREDTGELTNEVVFALPKKGDASAPVSTQPTGTSPKADPNNNW